MWPELDAFMVIMKDESVYQKSIHSADWDIIMTQAAEKGYPTPIRLRVNEFNVHYEGYFLKVFVI